jgi:hypothetical protein
MSSYKYFLYSRQQVNDQNARLDKLNRVVKLGVVISGGRRLEFSALSDKPELPRYSDVRIVAQGDTDDLVYTMPTSIQKRNGEV